MATTPAEIHEDIKETTETLGSAAIPGAEYQYDSHFISRILPSGHLISNRNRTATSNFAIFSRIKNAQNLFNINFKHLKDTQKFSLSSTNKNQKEILCSIEQKADKFLLSLKEFEENPYQDALGYLKNDFQAFQDVLVEACDEDKLQLSQCASGFILGSIKSLRKSVITGQFSFKEIIEDLDKIFSPAPPHKRLINASYEKFKSVNYAQFQRELMASPYRNNQILPMHQHKHPIIQDAGGYCHGLAVLGAYQILAFNRFFTCDLSIAAQYSQEKMNFLRGSFPLTERCQNGPYLSENHDNTLIISKFNTSMKTTGAASNFIANKLYSILNQCKDKDFAMLLTMRGDEGHHVGLVVKDNKYYLIDSDTGLFEFNDLNTLREFIAFLTKHYKYSLLFNRYTLENMPELESCFPLPEALKSVNARPEKETPESCPSRTLTFMRDKFYMAYCGAAIVQTAVTDKAEQTRDSVIDAYKGARALGSILRF